MSADNALAALGALRQAAAPSPGGSAKAPDDLRATAEEFEAIFLAQMAAHMFTDVEGGMFSGGPGEDTYRSMLHQEFGKALAKSGGIGIADAVVREMIRIQEGSNQ